jgi:hypothetical protein
MPCLSAHANARGFPSRLQHSLTTSGAAPNTYRGSNDQTRLLSELRHPAVPTRYRVYRWAALESFWFPQPVRSKIGLRDRLHETASVQLHRWFSLKVSTRTDAAHPTELIAKGPGAGVQSKHMSSAAVVPHTHVRLCLRVAFACSIGVALGPLRWCLSYTAGSPAPAPCRSIRRGSETAPHRKPRSAGA